ncbi:MAG: preprotein translocase subunit SecA [Brevinema sp.]
MAVVDKILELFFGSKQNRDLKKMKTRVEAVNSLEPQMKALSDDELRSTTEELRTALKNGSSLNDLLPKAYAAVREASWRYLGMRHFDVQIYGGIALHDGNISEMKTGEGKTLVATLPLYLNAIEGKGAHLVTVNDYLAKRDAQWMSPIYLSLGLTVGIVNQNSESFQVVFAEDGKTTTLIPVRRRDAYHCDITYITNNELGFDYLRDNMVFDLSEKSQRPLNFAIVDEADSILIDEARTPLIISGPSEEKTDMYYKVDKIIPRLSEAEISEKEEVVEGSGDFGLFRKEKSVVLTDQGAKHIEELLGIHDLYSPENSIYIHYILAGIKAHYLYQREVEYIVENGNVVIIDEFTGRKMVGRRWSDGIHQAIEAKEGLRIKEEYQTLASITFQNLFRMYKKLSGMTGTAETEAGELYSIYKTDVVVIPTNKPVSRIDNPDKMFISKDAKYKALIKDIAIAHAKGQPILVGTGSVEASEELSKLLKKERISHNVLNAKYHAQEADIIKDAGRKGAVTIATNMAGRGTDIKLGEGCIDLGGLLVLGAERHEARRIDNQLRGRSGRQGDPGESTFYVSFDDHLMHAVGMAQRKSFMAKAGFSEDDELQDKLASRVIEIAQKRLENFHFDIRKNILEYDGVMNEQRIYTYKLRDSILDLTHEEQLLERLIRESLDDYALIRGERSSNDTSHWDTQQLASWIHTHFMIEIDASKSYTSQEIIKIIQGRIIGRLADAPPDVMRQAIKFISLRTLDGAWKEHLRNVDALRNGIGLEGYAQKSPVVEYKLRASEMFRHMQQKIRIDTLSILCRLEARHDEEPMPSFNDKLNAKHSEKKQVQKNNKLRRR